ncbi:MAG: hypothetical protein M1832_006476, partial [Thelocarpon impressellum]
GRECGGAAWRSGRGSGWRRASSWCRPSARPGPAAEKGVVGRAECGRSTSRSRKLRRLCRAWRGSWRGGVARS